MAILTVDELREHITTDLGNDALQRLLDAAEEAIVARAGASGGRTEVIGGGYRFISLARPASAITSITELVGTTETTLVTDDYALRPGEMLLERLDTGTNPHRRWQGLVTVTYTPVADDATREIVQVELCALAINYAPGVTEETIGDWTERFTTNSAWNIESERETILAKLNVSLGMVVI